MALADEFQKIKTSYKHEPRANGITYKRVKDVLAQLGFGENIAKGAFALLDDTLESQFSSAALLHRFSEGATVAHVGSHIRVLQENGVGKVDREQVRDYVLKPLVEVGAVQPVTYAPGTGFVPGHVKAKSGNNAYRVTPDFVALLQTPAASLGAAITAWSSGNAVRARMRALGTAAAASKSAATTSPHSNLIQRIIDTYAPTFLPTYEVLYVDDGDGNRVTAAQAAKLAKYGLTLGLSDPYPDVILAERGTQNVWIAESVTSDGEVDLTKLQAVKRWCSKHGCKLAGATTAYAESSYWVRRQSALHNIADETYVWTLDDPGVHHRIEYAVGAIAAAPMVPLAADGDGSP